MTPRMRIVLRAELVARAVPLQPVLREHAGTGEADGPGSRPSPDRRFTPIRFGGYVANIRTAIATRRRPRARCRAMGGYAASRRWRLTTGGRGANRPGGVIAVLQSVGRLGSCSCPIAVNPSHRSGNTLGRGWAFARCASLASTAWTSSHQKLTYDAYSSTKHFPCMTASSASPGG
jgi:hypothetical protein